MSKQARKQTEKKQASRYVESSEEEEEEENEENIESTQLVAGSQAQKSGSQASLSSQTQNSQGKRQRQTLEERRKIRTGYRQLITDTTSKKQEYIQPGADGLGRALEKANSLYEQVSAPREAVLDSEFLTLASQIGLEQTSNLTTGFKIKDPHEFITKVRAFFLDGADAAVTEEEDDGADLAFDWTPLGARVYKYLRRTPTISFLNGPLSVEPTPRKERQRKEKDRVAETIKPEQLAENGVDQEALEKATSKRVESLHDSLEKAKKMDFFKFIVDPQSFSQTVENIFHYSFLIKDGQAALKVENGVPVVEPAQPPLQEDYTSGKANRSQSVIAITQDVWEKLKSQYGITDGYLPHRPVAQQNGLPPPPPRQQQQSQSSQSNGKQTPQKGSKQTRLNGVTKAKNSKKEMEEESSDEEDDGELSGDEQVQVTRRSTNQKRVITDLDENGEDEPQPKKRAKKSSS